MAHLHGSDGFHAGGGGGAGDAAGILVEAVHQIRRLVQHEVVLLHERVAHLQRRARKTSDQLPEHGEKPAGISARERRACLPLARRAAPRARGRRRRAAGRPWGLDRASGGGGARV